MRFNRCIQPGRIGPESRECLLSAACRDTASARPIIAQLAWRSANISTLSRTADSILSDAP
jgi:hypothetical protein